jgi:CDP-diacylglycerol---glycerol-3-phosphate 3-phosphatidyltransferase
MTFTIANILTLVRFFIAPIFVVCVLADTPLGMHLAVVLFVIGALTDYFDGALARRYGEETEIGVYLDPLADKVLTTAAFTTFYLVDVMPLWMLLVIVIRDFGTTVLRSVASSSGRPLVTSRSAKWKTFLQMCFIVYALVLLWAMHNAPSDVMRSSSSALLHSDVTYASILIITLFTLWTAIQYVVAYVGAERRAH